MCYHCLLSNEERPHHTFDDVYEGHTDELQIFVNDCKSEDPARRLCATMLVDNVREAHTLLTEIGDLKLEKLIM